MNLKKVSSSQNAEFILALRDSRVQFAYCDMPNANTLTVVLFSVITQHKRETTSQHTKNALQAKKAWGGAAGYSCGPDGASAIGLEIRQRNAREHGGICQAPVLILARRAEKLSCECIARKLNALALGFTARHGGPMLPGVVFATA